jgi:hypothetical protein
MNKQLFIIHYSLFIVHCSLFIVFVTDSALWRLMRYEKR